MVFGAIEFWVIFIRQFLKFQRPLDEVVKAITLFVDLFALQSQSLVTAHGILPKQEAHLFCSSVERLAVNVLGQSTFFDLFHKFRGGAGVFIFSEKVVHCLANLLEIRFIHSAIFVKEQLGASRGG